MDLRLGRGYWPQSVCWYDQTLSTPAENLALDEVLLNEVDADSSIALLRTWEPSTHFVVLGRSNEVQMEVDVPRCQAEEISIFRRSSGGGAVVVGPGCLAYTLVFPLGPELRSTGVVGVTQAVMETMAVGLSEAVPGITVCGTSDLVIEGRKFSGNSQRWLKNAFLHHGTILYDYELPRIGQLLKSPSREPEYRSRRSHAEFIGNFPITRAELTGRIGRIWNGQLAECRSESLSRARDLAASKYDRDDWNYER